VADVPFVINNLQESMGCDPGAEDLVYYGSSLFADHLKDLPAAADVTT